MTDIKEAQGLEVVAWQDAENPLYVTGEKRQMHGWATDGYPIVELIRLSDATALIDQLRERVVELESQQSAPAQQQNNGVIVPRELLYRIKNVYAAGLTMDSEMDELRALLGGDQPALTGSAKGVVMTRVLNNCGTI